jgi:Holliday junction DNA helicase RuvB
MSHRPQNFDEFVGQEHVKKQLKLAVDSANAREDVIDHVLLSGPAGLGKTTIANIVAASLGTRCFETIANVLKSPADAITSLVNLRRGDVLFIDEIHALPTTVQEYLYTAMEDYKINTIAGRTRRTTTIDLHKFVLIGATTIEGQLTGPLLSRFGIVCSLEPYRTSDLEEIIRRQAVRDGITIDDLALHMVADRCRATPRIALRQMRRLRDSATVLGDPNHITAAAAEHAYDVLGIAKHGLTHLDTKMVIALAQHEHAVGLDALAGMINCDRTTIETVLEPHLMRLGIVLRSPRGRKLTEKGHALARDLDK